MGAYVEIIFMYRGQSIVYSFFHVVFELCMSFLVQPGSLPGVVGYPLQILHFSRSPAPIVHRDKAYVNHFCFWTGNRGKVPALYVALTDRFLYVSSVSASVSVRQITKQKQ